MALVGTATQSPYSIGCAGVTSGAYQLTAVATDAAKAAIVNIPVNAPPTVSITTPTGGAIFTAPANIAISADAADTDGTIVSVAFYQNGTLITTVTAAPYNITWTGVPQGSYSLTAVATDDAGATATSTAVAVTVGPHVAQMYFVHPDHLNTPRAVSDGGGTIVWRWDQTEPFGDSVPDDNPMGAGAFEFNVRFPGQYLDQETLLAYNYFRDYVPALGRYAESDPIGLVGGINTYAYALSKPLRLADPGGLSACDGTWRRYKWVRMGPQIGSETTDGKSRNFPAWGCVCFWLCQPCEGAVVFDPARYFDLPSTRGSVFYDGTPGQNPGGGAASGSNCLCSKPGPDKQCNQCPNSKK